MMGEMVERVARAIDPERWAAIDSMSLIDAARATLIAAEFMRVRAAINALRHPPMELLDEVIHQLGESTTGAHWGSMIDEILK